MHISSFLIAAVPNGLYNGFYQLLAWTFWGALLFGIGLLIGWLFWRDDKERALVIEQQNKRLREQGKNLKKELGHTFWQF